MSCSSWPISRSVRRSAKEGAAESTTLVESLLIALVFSASFFEMSSSLSAMAVRLLLGTSRIELIEKWPPLKFADEGSGRDRLEVDMDYKPNLFERLLIEIINPGPDRTMPGWLAAIIVVVSAAVVGNLS